MKTKNIEFDRPLFLEQRLSEYLKRDYPRHSRVHPLQSFGPGFYVKREDELGFGISGAKFRKYSGLIPHILRQAPKEVVVIGGAFSNHILSITQLLLENGLTPTLFLKGSAPINAVGNYLFLKMLVPPSSMYWIEKKAWSGVSDLVRSYAKDRDGCFIVPEGAMLFHSFLGALTLALDIVKNEKERGVEFHHIYMDSGTGCSAIALLLGLAFMKVKRTCHILHLADTPKQFHEKLIFFHEQFQTWISKESSIEAPFAEHYESFTPSLAPSFGSTNRELFLFIESMAKSEGFFLDPIYSAKLFYEVKKRANPALNRGENSLIIHSGGALALSGFQDQIQTQLPS